MLTVEQSPRLYGAQSKVALQTTANMLPAAANAAHKHIWIVTGPAGCGKSTVAKYLAEQMEVPYIEGDEVRSQHRSRN
jgi:gluconokinase